MIGLVVKLKLQSYEFGLIFGLATMKDSKAKPANFKYDKTIRKEVAVKP